MQRHTQHTRPGRARLALVAVAATLAIGAAACGSDSGDMNDGVNDSVPSGTLEINTDLTPQPTIAGSSPLTTDTVAGDPMQPSTNDSSVVVSP